VTVRQIRPDEWRALRHLRLRALADTPDAFGSSLVEEEAYTEREWREWVAVGAAAGSDVLFVAEKDGCLIGLTGAFFSEKRPTVAFVIAMWVEPEVRGQGFGAELLEAVTNWAAGKGATVVELDVTETNDIALALYAARGFVDTGKRKPLPSNPALTTIEMRKHL
jgi:GNAT superfamily N-acetyltransferase